MTTFAYTALEPSGKKVTGFIEAKDRETAVAQVLANGKYVVDINEKAANTNQIKLGRSQKVSRADLSLFSRRLADLAAAGLPLDRVLQVIGEQSESPVLSEVAIQALEDVRGGLPVSQALAKHPRYFPTVYTETLKAGEASGQFAEVASRLADFQEMEVARRSQVTSALIYPSVLIFVAVSVVGFMLGFVVPRLSGIFADLGDNLHITTRVLLTSSNFVISNGIYIVGGLVGGFIALKAWTATEVGALAKDRLILRIPLLGKIMLKSVISRYARVLSTLVFGGVPILEALKLSGLAAGNMVFIKTSERVADDVRDGRSIHDSMRDSGTFPPVLTHMVAIGEETGDLPKMLNRVSDSLDFEVEIGLRRLTSLVEPLILVFMAVFVGFVVLAVVLPIFQAQDLVK